MIIYLKTVDFITTKILCSKLIPFYPLEYSQSIRNYDLENQCQGHYPLMAPEIYCVDH